MNYERMVESSGIEINITGINKFDCISKEFMEEYVCGVIIIISDILLILTFKYLQNHI